MGIESSSMKLFDKNGEMLERHEDKPSFWTTEFSPLRHRNKNDLSAEFQINFKDEDSAANFYNQIKDKEEKAESYYWNGNSSVDIQLSEDKKSIIFKYGVKGDENQ